MATGMARDSVSPEKAELTCRGITWYHAQAYAAWVRGRLPTEAEWEKACRGTDGCVYPWEDNAPSCTMANYNRCEGDPNDVGSYPGAASPYGALDMAGNLYEWTADWYSDDYYGRSPSHNPPGPDSGDERAVRGGAYLSRGSGIR
jgi:sulfatase modifying factor 1